MNTHLLRDRMALSAVLLGTAAVLIVVVLFLVLGNSRTTSPAVTDPSTVASVPTTPASDGAEESVGETRTSTGQAATSDPIAFARRTTSTLFGWDTTTDTPAAITNEILAVADPTGQETPGLLADLPAYLPDGSWWQRLGEYRTRQHLETTNAIVPTAWTQAVATGQVADLLPGTTAVTVVGIRHRSGEVAGQPEATRTRVEFTMFVVCPPDDECWLLRLGALGKALG